MEREENDYHYVVGDELGSGFPGRDSLRMVEVISFRIRQLYR